MEIVLRDIQGWPQTRRERNHRPRSLALYAAGSARQIQACSGRRLRKIPFSVDRRLPCARAQARPATHMVTRSRNRNLAPCYSLVNSGWLTPYAVWLTSEYNFTVTMLAFAICHDFGKGKVSVTQVD